MEVSTPARRREAEGGRERTRMQTVIQQLSGLFLGSVPTIIIFLLLHFCLRRVLYRPLRRTLAARRERTEGQFELARRTIALAEDKLTQYEHSLREARAEMYRIIEARRKAALEERARLLAAARQRAEEARQAAELQLEQETAQARRQLEKEAGAMAGAILHSVLGTAGAPQSEVGA